MMRHPFQCLLHCAQTDESTQVKSSILVAASGPYIHTFDVSHGSFLSTWPSRHSSGSPSQSNGGSTSKPQNAALNTLSEQGSRPRSKRQKISSTNDHYDSSSAEIIVENANDSIPQMSDPVVIKLAGTRNGRNVVAVTGDDKCIRTFDLSDSGILEQRSERWLDHRILR